MTAVVISTSEYPNYTQRVRLDGRDYLLRFNWRTRDGRWRLDILTDEAVMIVGGLAIETNWPLLRYYHCNDAAPQGELIAVATTSSDIAPGLTELGEGKRVELTYYPPAA